MKHTQLHWAATELGCRLPHDFRALYSWHNGQILENTLFDRLLVNAVRPWFEFDLEVPGDARGAFLSLAGVVRQGRALEIELSEGEYFIGRYHQGTPALLHPFACVYPDRSDIPVEGPDGHDVNEGTICVGIDSVQGSVLATKLGDDECIVPLAASLAQFVDASLEALRTGKILLPSAQPPPRTPRQFVDPGPALLAVLLEGHLIELSEEASRDAFASKLSLHLAQKPLLSAIETTVAVLSTDAAVAEVFVDDESLTRLVREFVGR